MNILKGNSVFRSTATFLLLSAGVVSMLCFQSSEIKVIRDGSTNLPNEQILSSNADLKQHLKIIKSTPSLGFRNLIANGVFLNFVQYFSSVSEQADVNQHLSPDFFEAIIALDPFYRDYYLFLSSSTTMYAAQPQKTVDIMVKGLAEIDTHPLSDSFYIWRYKGVDELLFLGDSQAAQQSFARAADWAEQSDAPESEIMGKASRQTAIFLANDPDSTQAQIAAWSSVLSNALNDAIRNKAVQRIQELGGSVEIREDGTIQIGTVGVSNSSATKKTNG